MQEPRVAPPRGASPPRIADVVALFSISPGSGALTLLPRATDDSRSPPSLPRRPQRRVGLYQGAAATQRRRNGVDEDRRVSAMTVNNERKFCSTCTGTHLAGFFKAVLPRTELAKRRAAIRSALTCAWPSLSDAALRIRRRVREPESREPRKWRKVDAGAGNSISDISAVRHLEKVDNAAKTIQCSSNMVHPCSSAMESY